MDTEEIKESDPEGLPSEKCIMCGRAILSPQSSAKTNRIAQAPVAHASNTIQEQGDLRTNMVAVIDGVAYAFDSDFCLTTFKKIRLVYGDSFCSDLKKWL